MRLLLGHSAAPSRGNSVACAAALAVLDLFAQDDYAARSAPSARRSRSDFIKLQERFPLIGDVRGQGGMMAIERVKDRATKEPDSHAASEVLAAAHRRGLVLIKAGMYDNVVRILVPLAVTDEQLEQGLSIFEDAVSSVAEAEAITTRLIHHGGHPSHFTIPFHHLDKTLLQLIRARPRLAAADHQVINLHDGGYFP